MNDWMKKVRAPTRYRIGNNQVSLKINSRHVIMGLGISFAFLILYLLIFKQSDKKIEHKYEGLYVSKNKILYEIYNDGGLKSYNSKYPLSPPLETKQTKKFKLLAIADLDTSSKVEGKETKFVSYLLKGDLVLNNDLRNADIHF
ncbi:soluble calcium-activated nucleotidase 1-like, partial [Brachionus plicatilis]